MCNNTACIWVLYASWKLMVQGDMVEKCQYKCSKCSATYVE